ncbi:hypothetical protein AGMMS49975_02820 [Clostridia bacterium]|nr:hypothetical protein AGMMS49975_02820 [Clostridia bacterium]
MWEERGDFVEILEMLAQYRSVRRECALARERIRGEEEVLEVVREGYERCVRHIREVEEFVAGVSDSRMRVILTMRYIRGKSWQRVAAAIGEYDESYPRKLAKKYLANLPKSPVL